MSVILGTIAAIAAAATTVTKALAVVGLAVEGLKAIGGILTALGKALGLIKPETSVEDLGDKALQSGYKPEDYDTYAEYVKDVEKYDLDPEKSKLTTEEEKITKGIELATGVTIEKFKEFPIDALCQIIGENKEFFTEDKIGELANLMQADGNNITSIVNFVNGSEHNATQLRGIADTLVSIEKKTNPTISDMDARKNVLQLKK